MDGFTVIQLVVGYILLLSAATGTGKTTKFPPHLAKKYGKTVVVVPTRFAAVSSAQFVHSGSRENQPFSSVGYETGEVVHHYMDNSQLIYMTPGRFIRSFHRKENKFPKVVMLDEAHIYTEEYHACMALCHKMKAAGVRIVLSSATISPEVVKARYGADVDFKKLDVPRPFPTKHLFVPMRHSLEEQCSNISDTLDIMVENVAKNHTTRKVNLVVLPGWGDITKFIRKLRKRHVCLPIVHLRKKSDIKFEDGKPIPAVYVATFGLVSSAITIPELERLFVCGVTKSERMIKGITGIGPVPITIDEDQQVMGRIGRTCEGVAYRFYDVDELRNPPHEPTFSTWRSQVISGCSNLAAQLKDKLRLATTPTAAQIDSAFYSALPYEQAIIVATVETEDVMLAYYIYALFLVAGLTRTHILCDLDEEQLFKIFGSDGAINAFFSQTGQHFLTIAQQALGGKVKLDGLMERVYFGETVQEYVNYLHKFQKVHQLKQEPLSPQIQMDILNCLIRFGVMEDNLLVKSETGATYQGKEAYVLKRGDGGVLDSDCDVHLTILPYAYRTTSGAVFLFSLLGLNFNYADLTEEIRTIVERIKLERLRISLMADLLHMEASTLMRMDMWASMEDLFPSDRRRVEDWNDWIDAMVKKTNVQKMSKKFLGVIDSWLKQETCECFCGECCEERDSEGRRKEPECAVAECGHVFHEKCLRRWCAARKGNYLKPTCPLCRKELSNYYSESDLSQHESVREKKKKQKKAATVFCDVEEEDREDLKAAILGLHRPQTVPTPEKRPKAPNKHVAMPPVFFGKPFANGKVNGKRK